MPGDKMTDMGDRSLRLFVTLIGDHEREPFAQVKYGYLIKALARKYQITVCDATLRGFPRIVNSLQVFTPDRKLWKERFYQNIPAFKMKSEYVSNILEKNISGIDLIFQIGVLYDTGWKNPSVPNVIYTDYTSVLSSEKPDLGRCPLSEKDLAEWIALEKQAFQRAAQVITRSEHVRASIIKDYQIPAERVTTVGGGINFDELPAVPPRGHTSSPTALFIGKDFYRKGGDLLLRAFAEARKKIPQARLIMVTDAPAVKDVALSGVEIIPPTWDRSVIYSLYQRADCFVLPSRLETWGDVLLESMAYGLPCIGVTGEGMGEIITDHQSGLLIPPEDVGALTGALIELLTRSDFREQTGSAARRRVESYFTWDHVVDRITPIIQNAVG